MTDLGHFVFLAAVLIAGGAIVAGVCAVYLIVRYLRKQGWL